MVTGEVPQGSILGSLLFSLFENHLNETLRPPRFSFAGDEVVQSSEPDVLDKDIVSAINWVKNTGCTQSRKRRLAFNENSGSHTCT